MAVVGVRSVMRRGEFDGEGNGDLGLGTGFRNFSSQVPSPFVFTMHLSLTQLAAITLAERRALMIEGKLRPEHVGMALKGSTRYIKALALGDIAADEVTEERVKTCAGCASMVVRTGMLDLADGKGVRGVRIMHCGPPFEERPAEGLRGPTCGCLVGILIDGKPRAEGKTRVGSERCGQGEWD